MEIRKTTTKVFKVDSIALDMFTFNEEFRRNRSHSRRKYSQCFKCRHEFQDGEKTSLAVIEGSSNEVLCHDCAVMAKAN